MALSDYTTTSFTHEGLTRPLLQRSPVGDPARGVIVIHEVPGITPAVLDFADHLVDRGATVWLPSLIGTPGQDRNVAYMAQSLVRVCVAKEFAAWASHETPPIVNWLRALARSLSQELGGKPVGALGMCFSGGFALGMAADPVVKAPVLSQPAGPFAIDGARRRSVHVSDDDLAAVVANGCPVMALRFTGDLAVPSDRFATLRERLGHRFIAVEIDSPDRALSIKRTAHSVLTEDLIDVPGHPTHAALEQVLDFFDAQLP
jgi:dienelactone hydrolase